MSDQLVPNYPQRKAQRITTLDYSSPGAYFITICTEDRTNHFGRIEQSQMVLNEMGKIVLEEWYRTKDYHPNACLDSFIVMPNHVHAVVMLFEGSKPLGTIVNSFKSRVSKAANRAEVVGFAWQKGYYDHVVRNEHNLKEIREYIQNNPAQWELDREYRAHEEVEGRGKRA